MKDLRFAIRVGAVVLAGYWVSAPCAAEFATTAGGPTARQPVSGAMEKPLPRFPYALAGRIGDGEGKLSPVLVRGDATHIARPGAMLPPAYRVESVSDDGLEVTYLPLGRRQRILFSELRSADPPVGAPGASDSARDSGGIPAAAAPREITETRPDGATVRMLLVPERPDDRRAEAPTAAISAPSAGALPRVEVRALPDGTLPAVPGMPEGVLIQEAPTATPTRAAAPPIGRPIAVEVVTTPGGPMPQLPVLPSDVAIRKVPPADARQRATIQSEASGPEVWIVGQPDGSAPASMQLPAGTRVRVVPGPAGGRDQSSVPR
jgi:hypothetical protein